ncbi:MAG: hypothetical protein K940chlam8_00150 [Chlamydiae bacterium]|nr:hypothetical protein [Chlamydiota bacterium]
MNNQQNNNLGMVFGSHLGLAGVAAPYTQKALEERLKMIQDIQAFLSLVFSMAPAILEKMQTVEKTFYTQASKMIKEQAYGQMAAGIAGATTGAIGAGMGAKGLISGGSLVKEGGILQSYSDKLSLPYAGKLELTSAPETTTNPFEDTYKAPTKQETFFKGLEAEGKLEQTPTLKLDPEAAKTAGNKLLAKTEVDPTAKRFATQRAGVNNMGKTARTEEFDKLDSNTLGKENEALREAYAQKFAAKAKTISEQGNAQMNALTGVSQSLGAIGSGFGGIGTGIAGLVQANTQLEQADTAAAKVANEFISQQFGKLSNSSIDELQAFVNALDAQVSVDNQINEQRG